MSTGNPVKSTMDPDVSVKYGGMIDELVVKSCAAVKAIDDTTVEEIRIKTTNNEVYILPDKFDLTFVIHQAPIEEEHPESSCDATMP